MTKPPDEFRPDLVGDGYDDEPLLRASEAAVLLAVPKKRVYELPIKRVRVGKGSIRWRPRHIREYIAKREESL